MSVASLIRQGLGSTPSDLVRLGIESGAAPSTAVGPIITLGLKYTPSDVVRLGLGASAGGGGPTYSLTLDYGTIAFTGSGALRDLSMVLDPGTISLSGQIVDLVANPPTYSLTLDPGMISLSGQAVTLSSTAVSSGGSGGGGGSVQRRKRRGFIAPEPANDARTQWAACVLVALAAAGVFDG